MPEARVAGHATGRRRLSAAQERAFERHARRFGHDAGRLCGGVELVSYPVVPSVAGVRALSAATPGQRRRRQQVFFNPVIELRRSIGQGVHDRLEAAVFADGTIDPADEARTGYHFPFPTRILSVRYRDVRSGESWDLSVRGERWGLDDRDDIMNVVNVGSLRLEPGATVLARGNLLILIIQRLLCDPAEPGGYQLAILPTPFSVDNGTGPLHGPGGAALSQRIAAHVVGNAGLSDEDQAAIAPAFPLTAHVTAAPGPLTVSSRYDLSTPDGSVRIASFTDVILEQGGYFVCESTPLTFTCTTLTRNGTSGSSAADFNILGKTSATPPTPPTPAGAGQAAPGTPGQCVSNGVAGDGGGNGSPGAPGTPGTAGATGGPGTPSMPATITVQTTLTVAGQLTIYSQSGPGGQGGTGGAGGPGQQGGNGGNGVSCDCTGNAGGQGGAGGRGGAGGAAGNGGNGVDAAGNVVIRVPSQADVAKVHDTTAAAPPGAAGQPGPGGPGGAGGMGGSGGKNNSSGAQGGSSGPGTTGAQGQPGTVSGQAAQITVTPV